MESIFFGTTARYVIKPQVGNPLSGLDKKSRQPRALGSPMGKKISSPKMLRRSRFVEDVDLLVNNLNDKAFLYNSGKIDVLKNNGVITRRFKNKKDASLYLLKTGWKYVR